jgi:hypothetical protein
MAVTPEQLCKNGTESGEQQALFAKAGYETKNYPELKWLYSNTNEEKTNSIIVGNKAKAAGRKAGISDVTLPVKRACYSGLYIELKRLDRKSKRAGSKGGCSDEQLEFGEFVKTQGFAFYVCYGWLEAWQCLEWFLNLK